MTTDDWFRNTTWNSIIESNFLTRLNRSKSAYHKSQYLRIQASYLLASSEKPNQLVGITLMESLINDYPNEEFNTIFANEQLGDYFLKYAEFEKAEKHFRIVVNHYKTKKSRSGTSGLADIKLVETILVANWVNKFEEAYNICKNFPFDELHFNSDKFYFADLAARLCNKMNKRVEAKEFARIAIQISKITAPQLNRHKTIGLVNPTTEQLQTLEQIIKE